MEPIVREQLRGLLATITLSSFARLPAERDEKRRPSRRSTG
jgi:hypothetical protein